jgi:pimeloyl-ACP methyl ester carboxylesterase
MARRNPAAVALGLILGLTALSPRLGLAATADATCKDAKAKATGKKVSDLLRSFGKDVKKENGPKLAKDLATSQAKFENGFAKAEDKGGCVATGDTAKVEALVDDFVRSYLCQGAVGVETVTIPSEARPAQTPGSDVVTQTYPKLVSQFGALPDLNNATYTRHFCGDGSEVPDAILILVPGFEGGASNFKILAENAIPRARFRGVKLEVWAFDRRGHQIEDREGVLIARGVPDAQIALDWFFGSELGLTLHPSLAAGPNRRAIFHNTQADTAFIANWTELVFSRDIDAVVERARLVARNANVFLGGHSAGTGFTARYAATDFNLTGAGAAEPGYAKLRGLVLLEGGGGSNDGVPVSDAELDLIEDSADGGLFHAVRQNTPSCVDGTPCPGGDANCAGKGRGRCVPPVAAYAIVPGLLNPRILATAEPTVIQALTDPDGGEAIVGADQGAPGNNAIEKVPDLATLAVLGTTTATGGLGSFLDDDGFVSEFATFVRTSLGAPGPVVNGALTWQEITEGVMPASVLPDNGPPPTSLPAGEWGQEAEVTRMDRILGAWISGNTNFTDWYYPSSGLGTTGGIDLDSTELSADPPVGRGRRDIENLTQAGNVDIPVICFGGSNGLASVPGDFVPFAQSLGACASPSCDGTTPRVVDAASPNAAFPKLGGIAGGFEVFISEGYAHIDVVSAEDGGHNQVIGPLVDFLTRNVQ